MGERSHAGRLGLDRGMIDGIQYQDDAGLLRHLSSGADGLQQTSPESTHKPSFV